MQYTAEFVERLKAEFSGEPYLHVLAEHGSKDLPLMIMPSLASLTHAEILEYLHSGRADELLAYCETYERRMALYYEAEKLVFGAP